MRRRTLTPKQQRFVAEYLVDQNATQAAIRAGYSKRTARSQASQLLSKRNIAAAVTTAREERQKRVEVEQDQVVKGLLDEALAAHDAKQYSAAIRAWELLGKHIGMFADRVDLNVIRSEAERLAQEAGLDQQATAEIIAEAERILKRRS